MLVVGIGHPRQRAHLAIGQPAIGKPALDLTDIRQSVANTQPLAHRAELGIDSLRDPMRATRRTVEGPLTREIELDQNMTKACMSSEMRRPAPMTSDRREDLGDNNAADIDKLRLLDFGVAMTQAYERSRS